MNFRTQKENKERVYKSFILHINSSSWVIFKQEEEGNSIKAME